MSNFRPKYRTVGTEKPNVLEPEPSSRFRSKPVETETKCCFKFRTGNEEFWNRPSTSYQSQAPKTAISRNFLKIKWQISDFT